MGTEKIYDLHNVVRILIEKGTLNELKPAPLFAFVDILRTGPYLRTHTYSVDTMVE